MGGSGYAVAKKLKITPSTFYKYENGTKLPSNETLDRIIKTYDLDPMKTYLSAYAERIDNPEIANKFRNLKTH